MPNGRQMMVFNTHLTSLPRDESDGSVYEDISTAENEHEPEVVPKSTNTGSDPGPQQEFIVLQPTSSRLNFSSCLLKFNLGECGNPPWRIVYDDRHFVCHLFLYFVSECGSD